MAGDNTFMNKYCGSYNYLSIDVKELNFCVVLLLSNNLQTLCGALRNVWRKCLIRQWCEFLTYFFMVHRVLSLTQINSLMNRKSYFSNPKNSITGSQYGEKQKKSFIFIISVILVSQNYLIALKN